MTDQQRALFAAFVDEVPDIGGQHGARRRAREPG
jgi:hypothetical protein